LIGKETPLSGIFGVEYAGHSWEALQQAVDRIVEIIKAAPNKDRVEKIITRWIKRHLQRVAPKARLDLDRLSSLVEDRDMLADNLENLAKKERLEGMLAGRQEGEHMKAEQIARNLIAMGLLTDAQIATASGLSDNEVKVFRKEQKH
jgi:predicted transposase YdaD